MKKMKVCDICGDAGFSDCLAICSQCKKGAEHVYCMKLTPIDTVASDWVCETCAMNVKNALFPTHSYKHKKFAYGKSVSFSKVSEGNDCKNASSVQSHSEVKSMENGKKQFCSMRTLDNLDTTVKAIENHRTLVSNQERTENEIKLGPRCEPNMNMCPKQVSGLDCSESHGKLQAESNSTLKSESNVNLNSESDSNLRTRLCKGQEETRALLTSEKVCPVNESTMLQTTPSKKKLVDKSVINPKHPSTSEQQTEFFGIITSGDPPKTPSVKLEDIHNLGNKDSSEIAENSSTEKVMENKHTLSWRKPANEMGEATNLPVSGEFHSGSETRMTAAGKHASLPKKDDLDGRSDVLSSSSTGNLKMHTGLLKVENRLSLCTKLEATTENIIENKISTSSMIQTQTLDYAGHISQENMIMGINEATCNSSWDVFDPTSKQQLKVLHRLCADNDRKKSLPGLRYLETREIAAVKDKDLSDGMPVRRCSGVIERETELGSKTEAQEEIINKDGVNEILRSSNQGPVCDVVKDDARDYIGQCLSNNDIINRDGSNDEKSTFNPTAVAMRSVSMKPSGSFDNDKLTEPYFSRPFLTKVEENHRAELRSKLKDPSSKEIISIDVSKRQSARFRSLPSENSTKISDPRLASYKCRKCNKFGHLARVCTEECIGPKKQGIKETLDNYDEGVCYKCNKSGHLAKLCTGECVGPNEQETPASHDGHVSYKRDKSGNSAKMCEYKCYNCNKLGHLARTCPDGPKQQFRKNSFGRKFNSLKDDPYDNSQVSSNEIMKHDSIVNVTRPDYQSNDEGCTWHGNIPHKTIVQPMRKNMKAEMQTTDFEHQTNYDNNRYDKKPRFETSRVALRDLHHPGVSLSHSNQPEDYVQKDLEKSIILIQDNCFAEGSRDARLNCQILQTNLDMVSTMPNPRSTNNPQYDIQSRNYMALEYRVPCIVDPFLVQPIPDVQVLWSGCLITHWRSLVEWYKRFQAHPSNMADPKVFQAMKNLPEELHLEVLERGVENNTWPRSFNEFPPTSAKIGMYYFPEDMESYINSYKPLLDQLSAFDLVLQIKLEVAQLLIFPSCLLPKQEQYWNGRRYLWGIFRPYQKNVIKNDSASQGGDNGEVIDMDIDMIGGAEVLPGCGY